MPKLAGVNVSLEYNFKGIIPVPAKALRAKKIIVSSLYLLLAFLAYDIFTYFALILDGSGFSDIYSVHGLAPFAHLVFSSFLSAAIYYLGICLSLFLVAIGTMAVAAFDIEELRGNLFFSSRQAIRFSYHRAGQLFLSWLAIALFIGFIILLGVIVGLIARIPYIGELLYSLFFFFPNFIVSLFTVLIVFVLVLSALVMPVAVAADRNGETFNSILETFSTIIRQPARWIGYTVYAVISAKVAGFVFAYFTYRAVQFLQSTTHIGGGSKINAIISSGAGHLPLKSSLVGFLTNIFPGIDFGFDISPLSSGGGYDGVIGYIMAASLFLIFLIIWGYIVSVIATGQAYAYVIIKKIRDGHAITDEKSLFYEEEWVNPPIEEVEKESENRNQQQ